eukprot:TRINITY_DN49417_c0_g1_i1.p1 TRINITY_DN49417_c0_g1~~TRINITY_DN49417_c0_g1_i1.p1  ORF type:complete len:304 (+),score=53.93 TRINITY_DN49417_c0_g1_i1:231-1142(+)
MKLDRSRGRKEAELLTQWTCTYLGTIDSWLSSDILEILRTANIRPLKGFGPKSAMSDKSKRVKDKLDANHFNVHLMCELGLIYASEGRWGPAMNVMLRGWKRAKTELQDKRLRHMFLVKLCEASYREGKVKQAQAVLMDIDENDSETLSRDEKKSFQILACRVHAANRDAGRALTMFNAAIANEDLKLGIRILALTVDELRKAGLYGIAKRKLESLAEGGYLESHLQMLDAYAEAMERAEAKREATWFPSVDHFEAKAFIGGCIVLGLILFGYGLHCLEQRSLARFDWSDAAIRSRRGNSEML